MMTTRLLLRRLLFAMTFASAKVSVLACLSIACIAGFVSTPAVQAAEDHLLFIEKIEITGEGSVSRSFLLGTIGIRPKESIGRTEFDERIAEAYQRLIAYGHYKEITIELRRGSKRDSYILHIGLLPRSAGYAGVSIRKNENSNTLGKIRSESFSVFGGSRNLANSEIKADLEGTLSLFRTRKNDRSSAQHDRRLTGYLIKTNIADTPWYSIFWASYSDNANVVRMSSSFNEFEFKSKTDSKMSYAAAGPFGGWRLGMFDSGLGLIRVVGRYTYASTSEFNAEVTENNFSGGIGENMLQAFVAYSQKPNIAAVEPGATASFTLNRRVSPKYDGPMALGNFGYTEIVRSRFGITGTLLNEHDWSHRDPEGPALSKAFDGALRLEYVTDSSWVLGVEGAKIYRTRAAYSEETKKYTERSRVFARYISPHFIADLSLVMGDAGLAGNSGEIGSTPGRAQ